ncbi:Bardet-Biedl syndrome 12 protein homolog [Haliotis rubra]|uniref:Bardet-Biedl syndrome 12 protein homolog n=1 Tax=Haliotis rubra TaxID=36100 RepID=UPI001EE602EE|nr:Bardet-Biedl syndrome 12 protein homolog [Haliotis rubra]
MKTGGGNSTDEEEQTDGVESSDRVCSVNHSDRLSRGNKDVSSGDVQSAQSVHAELLMPTSRQLDSGQVLSAGADGVSGKGLESFQQASGMVMFNPSLGSETFTTHPWETSDVASERMKLDADLLFGTCTSDHKCLDELSRIPDFCDKTGGSTVRFGERTLPSGETQFPTDMCWCEVADGLSHGCPEMMKLVVQAAASQMAMTRKHKLNLKLLHTCAVSGAPVRHTGVVPGLVARCDSHTLSHILSHTDKCWNVLLLNGDLSCKFRHKGYKDAVKGSCVGGVESVGHLSRRDQWLQHCVKRLTELSVDMVLVKGLVEERVMDTLTASGVVTVHSVPFRLLEALRESTTTELCVYVTEASKSHVCESLHVRPYFPSWCDHLSSHDPQAAHIVLDTAVATALQTIVLCHPSSHANDIQEQEVGLCSHRLANALHDGIVLPGGGEAEIFCAEYLQERCSKIEEVTCDLDLYRPVVTEAVADVFHKMGRLVTNNCAHPQRTESLDDHRMLGSSSLERTCHSSNLPHTNGPSLQHNNPNKLCDVQGMSCKNRHERSSLSFDNYNSKMAAWSAAMDTVAMVTQTDAHVVTGVSSDEDGRRGTFVKGITL